MNVVWFYFAWVYLIFVLSEGFPRGFSLLYMWMAILCRTPSRGAVEYARSTAVCIAQSCAVEYVYGRKACLFRGILVLGETVTTRNGRRSRWTSLLLRYNLTRESFQRPSWVVFTSPNCVRPVTPQSIDHTTGRGKYTFQVPAMLLIGPARILLYAEAVNE